MKNLAATALLSLALTGAASAGTTLFSDDFDDEATGLNRTPTGWMLLGGSVDVIGEGLFDLLPGNGRYVDLDGSSLNGGWIGVNLALDAGVTYTLSFDLAGSQRGGNDDVSVVFGTESASFTLASAERFGTRTLDFTPVVGGVYGFSFQNAGFDFEGALLDRVQVTAVPEPAPALMLLAGLAALQWRRRARSG